MGLVGSTVARAMRRSETRVRLESVSGVEQAQPRTVRAGRMAPGTGGQTTDGPPSRPVIGHFCYRRFFSYSLLRVRKVMHAEVGGSRHGTDSEGTLDPYVPWPIRRSPACSV